MMREEGGFAGKDCAFPVLFGRMTDPAQGFIFF
jgi:hypothetical protein